MEGLGRKRIRQKPRNRPTTLWRLWKKPSWEAKRFVLRRKRRQQKKLRAAASQLSDDVLEQIFSKLSLQTLLQIRPTCKTWSRVISSRVLEGIDLGRCMVQVIYRHFRSTPVALAHNPIKGVWRRIWWPSGLDELDLGAAEQVEGPFVLQSTLYSRRASPPEGSPIFLVSNLLTKEHHLLSEPKREPVPPCLRMEECKADRSVTLFDANEEGYKALMVTVVKPPEGKAAGVSGYFHTHIYTSVTNSWKHISCTEMIDRELWPEPDTWTWPWLGEGGCFCGRVFYLSFAVFSSHGENSWEENSRLWAFDMKQETWRHIPTKELYVSHEPCQQSQQTDMCCMFRARYVTCMGQLLAVTPYLDFEAEQHDGMPGLRFIIFQFSGLPLQGVSSTPIWKELSRMPREMTKHFETYEESLYFPVVNEMVYIAPEQFFSFEPFTRCVVIYNFRENSWEQLSPSCRFGNVGTESSVSVGSKYIFPRDRP